MAVTRRRSKLWWRKAHQSKALVELQRSRRSKRDLKPSGIQFYTVFNDFHVKKMSFSKKCRKSILTGDTIRKKLCWIQWCNPFWLKPSEMMSFWCFSFLGGPRYREALFIGGLRYRVAPYWGPGVAFAYPSTRQRTNIGLFLHLWRSQNTTFTWS